MKCHVSRPVAYSSVNKREVPTIPHSEFAPDWHQATPLGSSCNHCWLRVMKDLLVHWDCL